MKLVQAKRAKYKAQNARRELCKLTKTVGEEWNFIQFIALLLYIVVVVSWWLASESDNWTCWTWRRDDVHTDRGGACLWISDHVWTRCSRQRWRQHHTLPSKHRGRVQGISTSWYSTMVVTTCIAARHGVSNCICWVALICTAIKYMFLGPLTDCQPSPPAKWHYVLQPFLQSSRSWPTDRQTTLHATSVSNPAFGLCEFTSLPQCFYACLKLLNHKSKSNNIGFTWHTMYCVLPWSNFTAMWCTGNRSTLVRTLVNCTRSGLNCLAMMTAFNTMGGFY